MVVLKKIRASTLMETLVATVLIIVIFTMASLVMNSLLGTSVSANTQPIRERMQELEYQYKNALISVPYIEDWKGYEITVEKAQLGRSSVIRLEALTKDNKKTVTTYVVENQ